MYAYAISPGEETTAPSIWVNVTNRAKIVMDHITMIDRNDHIWRIWISVDVCAENFGPGRNVIYIAGLDLYPGARAVGMNILVKHV